MSAIDRVYNYVSSIGVNGKSPNCLINDNLELVPKKKPIVQQALDFFTQCLRKKAASVSISDVINTLNHLIDSPESSRYEKWQASFVWSVLEGIRSGRDPKLAHLARLNQLRSLDEHARDVQVYVDRYMRIQSCNETKTYNRCLTKLQKAASKFGSLPPDSLALIFCHLSLSDLIKVASVCKRWRAIASRLDVEKRVFCKKEYIPYLSSLIRTEGPLLEDVLKNRRLLSTYKNDGIHKNKILLYPHISFQIQGHGNNLILGYENLIRVHKIDETIISLSPHPIADATIIPYSETRCLVLAGKRSERLTSIYEVDYETGRSKLLFSPNIYFQLRTWILAQDEVHLVAHDMSRIITIDMRKATLSEGQLPDSTKKHFGHHLYISFNDLSNCYEVRDFRDSAKAAVAIANSARYEIRRIDQDVLYFYDSDAAKEESIVAIDPKTGSELGRYPVSIPFFYRQHEPPQVPRVFACEGLLYVESYFKVSSHDLLTGKYVYSPSVSNANLLGVTGNRLLYLQDTTLYEVH